MASRTTLIRELPQRLIGWYAEARRDLPWRRSRDPYRVWLAEVMLQQTRVETVVPFYERFLSRCPTLAALAEAPLDEVLKLWAGLGYYARARNLHAAARELARTHKGRIPRRLDALLALPGVGRCTAGAVRSIAFNLPAPILDGNVTRILCRLFGLSGNPRTGAMQRGLWSLAETLIPAGRARDFNQAMMELGAVVCSPNAPACGACPAADLCEANRLGQQLCLPQMPRRKRVPHYDVAVGLVWRRGRLLIAKRPPEAMLGGLWELPGGKREGSEPLEETVRRELREELGLDVAVGRRLVRVGHAYSHFRVTLHAFECRCPRGRPRAEAACRRLGAAKASACRWVAPDELADYPLPAGTVKILRALGLLGASLA